MIFCPFNLCKNIASMGIYSQDSFLLVISLLYINIDQISLNFCLYARTGVPRKFNTWQNKAIRKHNKRKEIKLIYIIIEMGNCSDMKRPISLAKSGHSLQRANPSQSQGLHSQLLCSQSHEIVNMCINRSCINDALYCSDPKCSSAHSRCAHIKLTEVITLIQKRLKENQQFIFNMQNIEKEMIQAVRQRMKAHLTKVLSQQVDKKYSQLVDAICYKKMECSFQGSEADDFYTKLKQSDMKRNEIQRNILVQFKKQVENMTRSLNNIQAEIIGEYIRQSKITMEHSVKNVSSDLQQLISKTHTQVQEARQEASLNSIIVTPQKTSQVKFILESLDQPKSVQLLFRASDHGFKAAAFHQKCDNVQNTLVIILTEHGKTVVGFTPLTWNCAKGFAMDQTGKTFLLALELKKKMNLIRPQKTIQCIPSYGPVFGGGSDIAITNQCNISNKNCTNFPYSFNCGTEFTYGQQSWKALCGVENGKNFNVVEYEVFKVTW